MNMAFYFWGMDAARRGTPQQPTGKFLPVVVCGTTAENVETSNYGSGSASGPRFYTAGPVWGPWAGLTLDGMVRGPFFGGTTLVCL